MTLPFIGFHFLRHNNVVIDTTHSFNNFPHLGNQIKSAASETSAKPEFVPFRDNLTVPPMTMEMITVFDDNLSKWNRVGTVTTVGKVIEEANLLKS